MKKKFIIILVAIATVSCKKDPIPILTMGHTTGLIVTNHNIKLETDTTISVFNNSALIDLDQDDQIDLQFEIHEYISPSYTVGNPLYAVEFHARNIEVNRQIILPEIPNSADWYVHKEKIHDTFGTFPRETIQEVFTCEPTLGSTIGSHVPGAVEIYNADAEIFSLPGTANENFQYSLWSMDYQYEYWEFNATSDTLIGYRKIKEAQCEGLAPFNQLFYIPFKLIYDDSNLIDRIGWIELRLTGNNTLEILRSAISSN